MIDFTRLTVVGSHQRATLVVPSEDPIGTHLGTLCALVHEPRPNGELIALVTALGEELDPALDLAQQGVLDGAVLRIVPTRELPSPPEVSDVVDAMVSEPEGFAPKSDVHRGIAGAAVVGIATALLLLALPGAAVPLAAGISALVFAALGAVLVRLAMRGPSWVALSVALASACAAVLAALPLITLSAAVWLLGAAIWAVLGIVFGLGGARTPVLLGAFVGLASSAIGIGAELLGLNSGRTAAIVALAGLVFLAVLPELALSASGLTRLDDGTASGRAPQRPRVLASIEAAYDSLRWAAFAAAGAMLSAIPMLLGAGDPWFLGLGLIVAALVVLRARVIPLAAPGWALWAAAIGGLLAGLAPQLAAPSPMVLAGLGAAVLLAAAVAASSPAAHTSVRLRQYGDALETVLALAVVPVGLGGFGVYAQMLGVFS